MQDQIVRVGADRARRESMGAPPNWAPLINCDDKGAGARVSYRSRVVVFVRYFLPGDGSGGPVRSVANLVARLGAEFDFVVFCSDRDVHDRAPYPIEARPSARSVGAAELHYLRRQDLRPWRLLRRLRTARADVLYLNSLFDPTFTLLPLAASRWGLLRRVSCIVSPRGEFAPAALAIKALKKRLFLGVARALGLYRGVMWRVSSESERSDLRRCLPEADAGRIVIAGELPSLIAPASSALRIKTPGDLRIVTTARISRMKNIGQAIRIAGRLRANIAFDIWGPIEDSQYWTECCAEIAKCPPNVRVRHRGTVAHADVPETLVGYHLFLLPSLGENFGHSIYEALACGLPAIISDRTPWRDLAAHGAGADLSLDDEAAFVDAMERYAAMDTAQFLYERERTRAFAAKWASNQDSTGRALLMFRHAVSESASASAELAQR
jgi:glycosyltransferase involved in cell wall biosynthesis